MKYLNVLLLVFFSVQLFGQNYKVTGKVVDASSKESLPGTAIQVENTTLGTITNFSGHFELSGIDDDQVKLIFSFIGYEPGYVICDFTKNTYRDITVKLVPSSVTIEEIEISGIAEGQVKALIEQQNAENIKNIVSSEQIEQFPDLNAAEAMQRIPGITLQRDQGEGKFVQLRGTPPELTNFNINGEQIPSPEGDVRYVGMDIISADQIEFIEITKVLTPDMDADGIGGSVNIITKKAQSEIPEIRMTASGGYSDLRKTQNYNMQFSFGQRKNKLGFHLNASHYNNVNGADNLEYKYIKGPFWGNTDEGVDNYGLMYKEMQLRHYNTTKKRTGLSATLDYELNDNSFFYLRGMFNNYVDDQVRRRKIYSLEDAITLDYYLFGGVEHDVKARTKNQYVNTLNMGGEHKFPSVEFDYEVAYAIAKEEEPNRLEAVFENPGQAITIEIDRNDEDWPVAVIDDTAHYRIAHAYHKFTFDQLLLKESYVYDINKSGKFNVLIPYTFSPSNSGYFKFGGKARIKNKERDVTVQSFKAFREDWNQYTPSDHTEPLYLTTVTDDFQDDNLLEQGYVVDNMPSPTKMREFYDFYPNLFIYGGQGATQSRVESNEADYMAKEDIYAFYGMFRHDFNNLMVLGGLRYERTDVDYQGAAVYQKDNEYYDTIVDTYDKRTHQFVLPQLQVKYSFENNANIRAAATYTFSRPNFEDVLPVKERELREIFIGNPELKFPLSLNIDLLAEKYLKDNGLLSAGVYYKKIDNFVAYYSAFGHPYSLNFSNIEIKTALNGKRAFVYGAEVQGQFKFAFLPGFLRHLGVFSNYSFTESEAYIRERLPANYSELVIDINGDIIAQLSNINEEEKIKLPGQAKHALNLALYYESSKIYAKISANYHDDFLNELGGDKDLDEYTAAAWHIDFTANYAITKNLRAFIDVINLTDAPLKTYLGSPEYVKQQEYYSWWGRIGIKLKL